MLTSFKPKVFIGSSSEGIDLARKLHSHLEDISEPTIWNQGIFQLTENTLESLIKATDDFDFAILIFSKDDILKLRNNEYQVARDNVIFEFGLFMGSIGKERTFYLLPKNNRDFRIPSDLLGINSATYEERVDGNILASLNTAADQIRDKIKKLRFKSQGYAKELELLFEKNGDNSRELNMPIISRLKNIDYSQAEKLCIEFLKQHPNSNRARYNLVVSLTKQSEKLEKSNDKIKEAHRIFEEIVNEDLLLFLKVKEAINDPIKFILNDPDFQHLFDYSPGLKDQVRSYKKYLFPDMGVKEYSRSGGCFSSEMRILLSDGSLKQIGLIEIGDKVTSLNNEGIFTYSTVMKKLQTTSISIFINENIKVTPSQLLLSDDRQWVCVGDLKIGNLLKSYSNDKIIINKMELRSEIEEVYCLELAPYHNYVIENIIAHNKILEGGNNDILP